MSIRDFISVDSKIIFCILAAWIMDTVLGGWVFSAVPFRLLNKLVIFSKKSFSAFADNFSKKNPKKAEFYESLIGHVFSIYLIILVFVSLAVTLDIIRQINQVLYYALNIYLLYSSLSARRVADMALSTARTIKSSSLPEARSRAFHMIEALDIPDTPGSFHNLGKKRNSASNSTDYEASKFDIDSKEAVIKTVVGSISRNSIDRVISPMFFILVGALLGITVPFVYILMTAYSIATVSEPTFIYLNKSAVAPSSRPENKHAQTAQNSVTSDTSSSDAPNSGMRYSKIRSSVAPSSDMRPSDAQSYDTRSSDAHSNNTTSGAAASGTTSSSASGGASGNAYGSAYGSASGSASGAVSGNVYGSASSAAASGYTQVKNAFFDNAGKRLVYAFSFLPARLSFLLLPLSSLICGNGFFRGLRIVKRDHINTLSPRGAWGESAFAGALQVQLGGNTYLNGGETKNPLIGDDIRSITVSDISESVKILMTVSIVMAALTFAILLQLS